MKENYDKTLNFILLHEGAKIVNIPGDHGGLTAFGGLTLATMQTLKLDLNKDGVVNTKDVPLVSRETIDEAFREYFWNKINGDKLPAGVDLILADVAWNSGVGKARQFMAEGFRNDIYALTDRRIRFYEYQRDNVQGQAQFFNGWENRANDALKEAEKLI